VFKGRDTRRVCELLPDQNALLRVGDLLFSVQEASGRLLWHVKGDVTRVCPAGSVEVFRLVLSV
jgi:hypothetical protein